jgi:uncharacterized membrane protein
VSETAAANGINALARSFGTSTSSAVIGAVLAGMSVTYAGHEVPTLRAFQVALLIAAAAATVAGLLALLIPKPASHHGDAAENAVAGHEHHATAHRLGAESEFSAENSLSALIQRKVRVRSGS